MPILHNSIIAAAEAADPVTRSLRFDGSSSRLSKTFSLAGNRKAYTFSCWVKKAEQGENSSIFDSGGNDQLRFTSSDVLRFVFNNSNQLETAAKFRDPSGWMSIVLAVDTTQSTSTDRVKIWVNGVLQTLTGSYPSQNSTGNINNAATHEIGRLASGSYYYGGYVADIHFIDGYAKSPTDFIESNDYGGYKPKAYTGSFGTNGFHVDGQPAHDADLLVSSVARNDGDTTFADAAQGHGLTVSGNTEHSIAAGNPFTGDDRAIYFDGSGDKIETGSDADFDFGTGDFTIECWFNPSSVSGSGSVWEPLLASNNYTSNGSWVLYQQYDDIYWRGYDGGTYANLVISSVLEANKWYHVAVTRESGTLKIYLNGEEVGSSSSFSSYDFDQSSSLRIGWSYSSYYYKDYMYDVRVVNGTAITPPSGGPTSNLTAVTNTKLLLQPDKDDSSWGDVSGNQTLTGSGNVATVSPTASTPYEAAAKSTAMHFDGSGDYLTVPTDADLKPESGDFTVEAWINYSSIPDSSYGSVIYGVCGGAGGPSGDSLAFMLKPNGHLGLIYGDAHYTGSSSTAMSSDTWYHVALVRSSGTVKLYIDGDEDYSATHSGNLNNTTDNRIGARGGTAMYFDGYMYDLRFTKGEARYTSSFTAPSAPLELNPVYIGADQSGNKNHFQPTNISGHDVMLDVPTKNYATLNSVSDVVSSGSNTFSNGNLTLSPSHAYNKAASTIAVSSGKWYAEVRYDSSGDQMAGIGRVDCLENTSNYIGQSSSAFGYVIYRPSGDMYHNGSTTDIFSNLSSGDILQIALDLDSNTVWWGLNGTWVGTVGSSGGTSITAAEYYFVQTYRNPCTWNFGQDNTFAGQFTGTPNNAEFAYEIPAGFKSLNSSNLDDPSAIPAENFGVALYNGNSSSNAITGLGFQPDVLWTKSRSTSGSSPKLFDSLRGVTKRLEPDSNGAETTQSSELSSFDSDGFTLGSGSGSNYSGRTYAAWNWKAHQSDARAQYTVRVEDAGGDAWDSSSSFYDYSTYLPNVYMEILESRNGTLVSLGKVAVRSLDPRWQQYVQYVPAGLHIEMYESGCNSGQVVLRYFGRRAIE